MGRVLAFLALFSMYLFTNAHADECLLQPRALAITSDYVSTKMTMTHSGKDAVTYQLNDDKRFVASFSLSTPPISALGLSLRQYIDAVSEFNSSYLSSLKSKGIWAELTSFPFEPVAWRIVEFTDVPEIGPMYRGRTFVRLNEDCMLTVDYLAPSSPNVMSRWQDFRTAMTDIRMSLGQYTTVQQWADEDNTPKGLSAVLGGYGLPLALLAFAYLMLNHLTRLDPPNSLTKIVIICSALASLCGLIIQHPAYKEALAGERYIDNALLLSTCVVINVMSLVLAQRATLMALLSSCITGVTIVSMSCFGWTPDSVVNIAVGISLLIMGVFGFLAWSLHSRTSPVQRLNTVA